MRCLQAFKQHEFWLRNAARGGADDPVLREDIENIINVMESSHNYSEVEIKEMLHRTLTEEELDLTQALLEGFTQGEIAKTQGITQQAVTKRLKKVRKKLKEVIDAL